MARKQLKFVEVNLNVDQEALNDMEFLKAVFGSPNFNTAVCNAVAMLKALYQYQAKGYKLKLVKDNDVIRFRLPVA